MRHGWAWFTRWRQYGHKLLLCLQGACSYDRKKIIFKFWQTKNWVGRPKYVTHTSALCLQKEKVLLKITKWCDLNSDIRLPLYSFIKITRTCSCRICQYQNDHLDMVLHIMQENHDARFRNWLLLMPKVVIRSTWSNLTICNPN